MKTFFAVIFTLVFLAWVVVRIVMWIQIDFDCYSYLKRAADANTVEMAKPNLDKAIKYLEDRNLTTGIVSIIFRNPANDVEFFYNNLKASQAELEKVDPNISQLEESNLLMKLRETLLDQGEKTKVTHPNGLSVYPNNVIYMLWGLISFILMVIFGGWAYSSNY